VTAFTCEKKLICRAENRGVQKGADIFKTYCILKNMWYNLIIKGKHILMIRRKKYEN